MFSNFVKCFALRRKSVYDVELAEEKSNYYDKVMENLGPEDIDKRKGGGGKGHSSAEKYPSNASNGSSGKVSVPFPVQLVSYHYQHHPRKVYVKAKLEELKKLQFSYSWSLSRQRGQTLDGNTLNLLLEMCGCLKLSHVTRFHAFELYDRFILSFERIAGDPKANHCKPDLLLYTFNQMLILRMFSCIQLASKIKGRKSHVQASDVKKLLPKFKGNHSQTEIVESEFQVISVLDYDISGSTPLEHAECILTLLELPEKEFNGAYALVVQGLTYVYLKLDQIYKSYYDCLLEKHVLTMSPDEFLPVKFNYTLRAAAAIQFTLILRKPGEHLNYLVKVAYISGESDIRILELARCILLHVF